MTRGPSTSLLCALLALGPAGLDAQEPQPTPADSAQQVVMVSERSPVAAGVFEWFLPTVGYAYAGNWARGIPSAVVRITGAIVFIEDQFVIFGPTPPCEAQCLIGAAMLVGGTIWAIVDAAHTATRENERRRASVLRARLTPIVGPAGAGVGISIPVGW